MWLLDSSLAKLGSTERNVCITIEYILNAAKTRAGMQLGGAYLYSVT